MDVMNEREALEMDSTIKHNRKRIPLVVFTGAGASRAEPINMPTMYDFFNEIVDKSNVNEHRLISSQRHISANKYFEYLFKILYGDNNNYDLERVMGVLYQITDIAGSNDSNWQLLLHPDSSLIKDENMKNCLESNWDLLSRDSKRLLYELEDLVRKKYGKFECEKVDEVYAFFFHRILDRLYKPIEMHDSLPVLPIFTTNYDMNLDYFFIPIKKADAYKQQEYRREKALCIDVNFVNGFCSNNNGLIWNQDRYLRDYEEAINNGNKVTVMYHKLHGSLLWEKNEEGHVARGQYINVHEDVRDKLMIVYPSDKKILMEDPYRFCHERLRYYLALADNLTVIGFAFRDPAITQEFSIAMSKNKRLKLQIINKGPRDDLPEEAVDFLNGLRAEDRITYIKDGFGASSPYMMKLIDAWNLQ
jgi:hypothetical protein